MRYIAVIIFLLIAGCIGTVTHQSRTDYPDGSVLTTKTKLKTPFYPLEQSSLTVSNDWVIAILSPSQDAAGIKRADNETKETIFLYGIFGLLVVFGGFLLYRKRFKTAFLSIGCGIVGIAAINFIEAAEPVMKYILPALIIAGAMAVAFLYFKQKTNPPAKAG